MDITIAIAGPAGLGINTVHDLAVRSISKRGKHIFSNKDYMSRVRGGFNFTQIRICDLEINSHKEKIDILLALDDTSKNILYKLDEESIVICSNESLVEWKNSIRIDEKKIKSLFGRWTFPMASLGVLYKVLGFHEDVFDDLTYKKWSDDILMKNKGALKEGYNWQGINNDFLEKYKFDISDVKQDNGKIIVNGNQSLALGAAAAGLSFYFAYPMAPSTGIMNYLMKYRSEMKIIVEQAEDEIAAINGAIGASASGVRAMTGSSGGGFSLMVEGLGLSAVAEVPLVVVNVQRPGPATGLPTRTEQGDLNFVAFASQGEFARMIIAPRTIEESFYETFRAFNVADKYNIPVIILTDEYLGDSSKNLDKFNVDSLRIKRYFKKEPYGDYKRYDLEKSWGERMYPGMSQDAIILNDSHIHDEYGHTSETQYYTNGLKEKFMEKINVLKSDLKEPEYFGAEDPEIVLIGWGSTYGAIKEAVSILSRNFKIGALLFSDVFPVPKEKLLKYYKNAKIKVNIEQNYTNQFGKLVQLQTGIIYDYSINKYDGRQMTSEFILKNMEDIVNE